MNQLDAIMKEVSKRRVNKWHKCMQNWRLAYAVI